MPSFNTKISPERREVARFIAELQDVLRTALAEEYLRDGTNQQRIADALDVDKSQISRWLSGANRNITAENIARLAFVLKRRLRVTADHLVPQSTTTNYHYGANASGQDFILQMAPPSVGPSSLVDTVQGTPADFYIGLPTPVPMKGINTAQISDFTLPKVVVTS